MKLRIATYNIHSCVGLDGRRDVGRIAAVIAELEADVVGLQEVDSGASCGRASQAEELARRLGMDVAAGPLLADGSGHLGNAVLSRHPITVMRRRRFARVGRAPRGFLHSVVHGGAGAPWHVLVTHLSLGPVARGAQLRVLAHELSLTPAPAVLIGDLNEWRRWARGLAALRRVASILPTPPSFPSRYPVLRLDRIVVRGGDACGPCRAHRSPLSRDASDHLPVLAEVTVAAAR